MCDRGEDGMRRSKLITNSNSTKTYGYMNILLGLFPGSYKVSVQVGDFENVSFTAFIVKFTRNNRIKITK